MIELAELTSCLNKVRNNYWLQKALLTAFNAGPLNYEKHAFRAECM